jgi:hypothetical protein
MMLSDMQQWQLAWSNIKADFRNGVVDHHQFLKEREYMRQSRIQIENRRQADG